MPSVGGRFANLFFPAIWTYNEQRRSWFVAQQDLNRYLGTARYAVTSLDSHSLAKHLTLAGRIQARQNSFPQ
jgi:hypothetical protein